MSELPLLHDTTGGEDFTLQSPRILAKVKTGRSLLHVCAYVFKTDSTNLVEVNSALLYKLYPFVYKENSF